MAQTQAIDALLDQLDALERCAVALAREEAAQAEPGLGAAAARAVTHGAAHTLRTATRRFPLIALAAAFGLGVYIAARFER